MHWKGGLNALLLHFFLMQLIFVKGGYAIHCYICDSSIDPDCAVLKKNSHIQPQLCAPRKMTAISSWLNALNTIELLESSNHFEVAMHCQKLVAKKGNVMVTARFCQIDTKDTDACEIPKKNAIIAKETRQLEMVTNHHQNEYDIDKNGHKMDSHNDQQNNMDDDNDIEILECSICATDNCNGCIGLKLSRILFFSILLVLILIQRT